jgi:hypothetical protein
LLSGRRPQCSLPNAHANRDRYPRPRSQLAPGGKSFKEVLELVDRAQKQDAAAARLAQQAGGGGGGGKPAARPVRGLLAFGRAGKRQGRTVALVESRCNKRPICSTLPVPKLQQPPTAITPPLRARQAGQAAFFKPSGRLERDTRAETAKALGQSEELGLGYGEPGLPGAASGSAGASGGGGGGAPAAAAAAGGGAAVAAARPQRPAGGKLSRAAAVPAPAAASGKKRQGPPIILVPAGLSALVNMYNARQLLEEGLFVHRCGGRDPSFGPSPSHPLCFNQPTHSLCTTTQTTSHPTNMQPNKTPTRPPPHSQEVMAASPQKPTSCTFRRTLLRDKPVPYVVTDKPPARGSSDWKRVVAVIVQVGACLFFLGGGSGWLGVGDGVV